MTLTEVGIVVGIASTVGGLGVGVFRWMLKGHEDVCAERYAGIQRAAEAQSGRMDSHDQKLDQIIGHLLAGKK